MGSGSHSRAFAHSKMKACTCEAFFPVTSPPGPCNHQPLSIPVDAPVCMSHVQGNQTACDLARGWLLSLPTASLRCVHAGVGVSTAFLAAAIGYARAQMDHVVFIHGSLGKSLGRCHLWAAVNCTAVNIRGPVCVGATAFNTFGSTRPRGVAGSHGNAVLRLLHASLSSLPPATCFELLLTVQAADTRLTSVKRTSSAAAAFVQ